MKIIRIKSCETCSCRRDSSSVGTDSYCCAEHRYFSLTGEFPSWCPLDDVGMLIEEAKLQAGLHPSKDARVFARNVFNFLTGIANVE